METEYQLRPAQFTDADEIRALIKLVRINPIGLNWQRFWIAQAENGGILGCGQLKSHFDGSLELASIAVLPKFRHQGIASAIIQQLLLEVSTPVYLTCRKSLLPFYQRFGFISSDNESLPLYFKWLKRVASWLYKCGLFSEEIAVLIRLPRKDPPSSGSD
ncbi:MAG: GNAT family N-acetyltransferase [Chloroflexota bacterium]